MWKVIQYLASTTCFEGELVSSRHTETPPVGNFEGTIILQIDASSKKLIVYPCAQLKITIFVYKFDGKFFSLFSKYVVWLLR